MSDIKENFWSLKRKAADVGISSGQMGKLATVCGNYAIAKELLDQALCTKQPPRWLGAVIRDWTNTPEIVRQARRDNIRVVPYWLSDGTQGWRIGGAIYNKDGVNVGG